METEIVTAQVPWWWRNDLKNDNLVKMYNNIVAIILQLFSQKGPTQILNSTSELIL